MSKSKSREYAIIHPHKLSLRKLRHGLRDPQKLNFHEFTESSAEESGAKPYEENWRVLLSMFLMRILHLAKHPLKIFGNVLEWILNFIHLNGGPIKSTLRLFTGRLELPKKGTERYISFIGMLERRTNLYAREAEVAGSHKMESPPTHPGDKFYIDLTAMCSGVAYENENVIKHRVIDIWKMQFVKFYNLWNDRSRENTTQAFICTDKEEDANLIILTFRGTEPFNADDWSTDADMSWYTIPSVGKVHVGFMEALGVANRFEARVMSKLEMDSSHLDKPLAYHTLVQELKKLMNIHKNAKIIVTGHSLGGALAILFAAVLVLRNEDEILKRVQGVYTFGQPRVGDEDFGNYVNSKLNYPVPKYYRIVYSNDLVPRVPFDDFVFLFKHFGTCLYYDSRFREHNLPEEPNRNFSVSYFFLNRLNALLEAIHCFLLPFYKGKQYRETLLSTIARFTFGFLVPGVISHSLVNYVHSADLLLLIFLETICTSV